MRGLVQSFCSCLPSLMDRSPLAQSLNSSRSLPCPYCPAYLGRHTLEPIHSSALFAIKLCLTLLAGSKPTSFTTLHPLTAPIQPERLLTSPKPYLFRARFGTQGHCLSSAFLSYAQNLSIEMEFKTSEQFRGEPQVQFKEQCKVADRGALPLRHQARERTSFSAVPSFPEKGYLASFASPPGLYSRFTVFGCISLLCLCLILILASYFNYLTPPPLLLRRFQSTQSQLVTRKD